MLFEGVDQYAREGLNSTVWARDLGPTCCSALMAWRPPPANGRALEIGRFSLWRGAMPFRCSLRTAELWGGQVGREPACCRLSLRRGFCSEAETEPRAQTKRVVRDFRLCRAGERPCQSYMTPGLHSH